jgi:hypothetical protein
MGEEVIHELTETNATRIRLWSDPLIRNETNRTVARGSRGLGAESPSQSS